MMNNVCNLAIDENTSIPPYFLIFLNRHAEVTAKLDKQNTAISAKLDVVLNLSTKISEIEKSVIILQDQMTKMLSTNAKMGYEMGSCDLVVSDFPESENENLETMILKTANCLNVLMDAKDIISVTRVPSQSNILTGPSISISQTSSCATVPCIPSNALPPTIRPRTIMTRLSNKFLRTNFIRAMRDRRSILSTAIDPSLPSTRFYINEHLPIETLQLLKKARSLVQNDPRKSVYIYRGIIKYRSSRDSSAIEIISEDDLRKITELRHII